MKAWTAHDLQSAQIIAPQPVVDTACPMARPVSISCCTPTATCRKHGRSARCMQHGTQQHARAQTILAQSGCWRPAQPGRAGQGRAHASPVTIPFFHLSAALHCRQSKLVGGVHSTSHNARGAPHRGTSDVGGSLDALPGPLHSSGAGKGRHGPAVLVGCQLSTAERSLPPAAAAAAVLATGGMQRKGQPFCRCCRCRCRCPCRPGAWPLACAPRFIASCTNCAGVDADAGVGAGTGVAASWLGATSASGAASQGEAVR